MKRPVGLAVLTVLAISLSLLIFRAHKPSQFNNQVLAVMHAQRAAAQNSSQRGRLLLFPYATRIARIDATACPDDFFQAWEKYVSDVQTLSAIRRANAGKAILFGGIALFSGNPETLLGAMPEHPEQAEISFNTATADWQNVRHIALHYGIRIIPIKYSERSGPSRS